MVKICLQCHVISDKNKKYVVLLFAQRLTAARQGYSFSKTFRSLNTSTYRKINRHAHTQNRGFK